MSDTYRTDQVGVRQYKDVSGNPCSLSWLVRNEPEWAANQIRNRDKLERELNAANERIKQLEADKVNLMETLRDREERIKRLVEIGNEMVKLMSGDESVPYDDWISQSWDAKCKWEEASRNH